MHKVLLHQSVLLVSFACLALAFGSSARAQDLPIIINQPPTANDDTTSTNEDTAVTTDVRANDTDPDNATSELVVTVCNSATNGSASKVDDANCQFTPTANYSGPASYRYVIQDSGGLADTATVSVTVNPINDPPVATDDTAITQEDTPVTTDVRSNDTDIESATGDLVVTTCGGATNGSANKVDDARCQFTPAPNYNGPASYTYTIQDPGGDTDQAVVTVTVNSVNDLPVANDDAATTAEDVAVPIDVRSNDSDVEGPLSVTAVTQPSNGSVSIGPGGSNVTYSPNVNFNGQDTFTYTISDGSATDGATVTVNVTPVNDNPNAVDDGASTPERTPVTIPVRTNDTDPDGHTLTVVGVTQPANGTTAISGGGATVTYTPNANFNGVNTFTYTISDGNGGSDVATVTVRVSSTNTAAPNATIDSPSSSLTAIQVGQTVTFAGTGTDSDGTISSYSWDFGGGASNSSAQDPGAVQFNVVGLFTVTFNVTDNEGAVDPTPPSRQVQVSQGAPGSNQPPNATIDSPASNVTVAVGQSVSFTGTALDPDGSISAYAWSFPGGTPSASTAEDPGFITFSTPGVYTVTFNATDDKGATDVTPPTRVVSVTSTGGNNQPPNATIVSPAGNVTIQVGGSVNFEGEATDADGGILGFFWDFSGGAPSSTAKSPGTVSFSQAGTYLVQFNVIDNGGASDPSPPTLTVVVGSGGGVDVERLNVDGSTPGSEDRVDGHDVIFVLRAMVTQDLRGDVSGDGVVNDTDVQLVRAALGEVDE